MDRLHQEDFCRALGRPRTQKYEAQDGVSLGEMFAFCADPGQVVVPALARKALPVVAERNRGEPFGAQAEPIVAKVTERIGANLRALDSRLQANR